MSATDGANETTSSRSIAVIGAGFSGIGILHGLLEVKKACGADWSIDCFERRDSFGGIWHVQPCPPDPPDCPESSLYEDFQSLSLSHAFTLPGKPMPKGTPLFVDEKVVKSYVQDQVNDFGLSSYIHLNHTVVSMELEASSTCPWTVTIEDTSTKPIIKHYSTVIICTGPVHTPKWDTFHGQEEWLAASQRRRMMHGMWFRNPKVAKGKVAIVVGSHPTGTHVVKALLRESIKVYHSFIPDPFSGRLGEITGPMYQAIHSRIAHMTARTITFQDGTTIDTPEDCIIIQCTGYQLSYPYLDKYIKTVSGTDFSWDDQTYPLERNQKYIRPLYQNMLPVSSAIPFGSLVFGGKFSLACHFHTAYAQGLWLGHVLANRELGKDILPPLDTAYSAVRDAEREQLERGNDITKKGHLFLPVGIAVLDYCDKLVEMLRSQSAIHLPAHLSEPGQPISEAWRRRIFEVNFPLRIAWDAAKAAGVQDSFTKDAVTEADFADSVEKMVTWSETLAK